MGDAERSRTARLQVLLDEDVVERAKRAVFWTPGLTLTALVEEALVREVARLEAERGTPFEPRTGRLTPGRRPT